MKSGEVTGNAGVMFSMCAKESATDRGCNICGFGARKRVRKLLQTRGGFACSWSKLGKLCAGADEVAERRTGSDLCGGYFSLTNMRHYIMDVNYITHK
jgi:hypothetical protein